MNVDRLAISVTHADGRVTRWGPDEPDGADVPEDLIFSTALPGGFKAARCKLLRRLDLDYDDLALVDDVRIYGAGSGKTAWEGRQQAFPKSHGDDQWIEVNAVGWSANLKDNYFVDVYIDKRFSSWKEWPLAMRLALAGSNDAGTYSFSSGEDSLAFTGPANQSIPLGSLTEAFYTMPTNLKIEHFQYQGTQSVAGSVENPTLWTTDDLSTYVSESLTLDDTLRSVTPTSLDRYGMLRLYASSAYTSGSAGDTRTYKKLAAYGNSRVTRIDNGTEPDGFYASDLIKDIIDNYVQHLSYTDTSIQQSYFVVPHAVFEERTTAEDAITQLNGYERYDWFVWEDRTFHYQQPDDSDYDWELRRKEDGVHIDSTGETMDQLFNGVYVVYTDPAGDKQEVTPDDDSSLKDTSTTNPLNQHGLTRYGLLNVSPTTDQPGAIQIGKVWLDDHKTLPERGTATVTGFARSRAGDLRPSWEIRAGDYVWVSDLDSTYRKVVETSYDYRTRTNTLTLDNSAFRLDQLLERLGVALVGVVG